MLNYYVTFVTYKRVYTAMKQSNIRPYFELVIIAPKMGIKPTESTTYIKRCPKIT